MNSTRIEAREADNLPERTAYIQYVPSRHGNSGMRRAQSFPPPMEWYAPPPPTYPTWRRTHMHRRMTSASERLVGEANAEANHCGKEGTIIFGFWVVILGSEQCRHGCVQEKDHIEHQRSPGFPLSAFLFRPNSSANIQPTSRQIAIETLRQAYDYCGPKDRCFCLCMVFMISHLSYLRPRVWTRRFWRA